MLIDFRRHLPECPNCYFYFYSTKDKINKSCWQIRQDGFF